MNPVIYTHSFAPQIGGVETVVFSLAQGLARNTFNWRDLRPAGYLSDSDPGNGRYSARLSSSAAADGGVSW